MSRDKKVFRKRYADLGLSSRSKLLFCEGLLEKEFEDYFQEQDIITEEKTENKEYIGSGKQNQNMMIKDDKIIHTALSKKESPRNKQIQKKNKDIVANFTIIVNKYQ